MRKPPSQRKNPKMKLNEAVKLLTRAGIEDARAEARMLFSKICGADYATLLTSNPEYDDQRLVSAIMRRCEREPLQYILGEVEFYRESYKVTTDCLIPRSDTEILVDYAVKNLPSGAKFLDLCTGSGCVAISTLKNTENTTAVAIDISEATLSLAIENAERAGVAGRLTAKIADVFSTVEDGEFYAVLSNPPYVTEKAYAALEPEIYREPKIAFVGGVDGMDFYKRIIPAYKDKINENGFIAFEIGYDQGEAISSLAAEHSMTCEITKDLSGLDRVAILKR